MSELMMINGPIRKFIRQLCNCKNSTCTSKIEIKNQRVENDKFFATLEETSDVCSICKAPYEVTYDFSNVTCIKNIGETNEPT